jgi:hypothetical protein
MIRSEMDRRTFHQLAAAAAIAAIAEGGELRAQSSETAGAETVLEDEELLVAFDRKSGALTRMVRKPTNWVVQRRPETRRLLPVARAPAPAARQLRARSKADCRPSGEGVTHRGSDCLEGPGQRTWRCRPAHPHRHGDSCKGRADLPRRARQQFFPQYNFSPDHGYTPPGYLFSGDIPLARQFRAAADKVDPEFLFSGEGPGDWLMPYDTLGYYRIGPNTRHALRYLDPRAPLMAAVRGFDARDEINLTLAYRYIISYEPLNFKGHVTDFPLTLAYGKRVDALRRRYRRYLWDADFRDTLGAAVTADGDHRHSVFVAQGGTRAVVVVNLEQGKTISAKADLPDPGRLAIVTPEKPDPEPASGTLRIPARSAAVVLES